MTRGRQRVERQEDIDSPANRRNNWGSTEGARDADPSRAIGTFFFSFYSYSTNFFKWLQVRILPEDDEPRRRWTDGRQYQHHATSQPPSSTILDVSMPTSFACTSIYQHMFTTQFQHYYFDLGTNRARLEPYVCFYTSFLYILKHNLHLDYGPWYHTDNDDDGQPATNARTNVAAILASPRAPSPGPSPPIPSHNEELVAAAHHSTQLSWCTFSAKSRGLGQAVSGLAQTFTQPKLGLLG